MEVVLQGAESTGPDCTTGLQQKVLNSREQSQHSRTLTRGNVAGWYCLLGLLESYLCQIFETDSVLTQVWGSAGSNATRTGRMKNRTTFNAQHPSPTSSIPLPPPHPLLSKKGRNQQTNFCPLGKKKLRVLLGVLVFGGCTLTAA